MKNANEMVATKNETLTRVIGLGYEVVSFQGGTPEVYRVTRNNPPIFIGYANRVRAGKNLAKVLHAFTATREGY